MEMILVFRFGEINTNFVNNNAITFIFVPSISHKKMYTLVYILFKQLFLVPIKVANWFICYNCFQLLRS